MKKLLLILLYLGLFFSCANNSQKNTTQNLDRKNVIRYSVTSKNPELTSKTGTNVSMNEMTTKNVESGDIILFKGYYFTLDTLVEDGFNFYSKNGKLMCNVPNTLSVMSMPPNGNGLNTFSKGDNIEISGITLIKLDSINFVISDIILY